MKKSLIPSLIIADLPFYDTPSHIEGSPYWVDLWGHVNGYRIGLQVKPKTFRSSSLAIYTGKARSSQARGHLLFQKKFGGKVIMIFPEEGEVGENSLGEIITEIERLNQMPPGPYPPLFDPP